ncbi:MAG TPA: dienelactone hydrolase family protein [Terriglobales bacterium]|nr:dienelactone hydrolase family protein [Terriglobales bacterium]
MLFPNDHEMVSGFLVLPEKAYRQWAIILLHEWWGLNDWVREQARKLGANGYIVLAVDLYQGKVTSKSSEARKLKRGLQKNRAIRDMKAAFNYLAGCPGVDPKRIGSIGWSMGGGLALQLAVHEPRLAACVVNYGMPPQTPAEIRRINARVLGNFGALDRGVPVVKVLAFEKAMKALKKSVDIKVYRHAGHAFANPDNTRGYRPQAADDAWSRILAFLGPNNRT